MPKDFSSQLKELAEKQGWSLQDIADITGKPPGTVWGWFNRGSAPGYPTQLEILQRLGLLPGNGQVDLVEVLISILNSAEPLLQQFLRGDKSARIKLRQQDGDFLYRCSLYLRALNSEDVRQRVLEDFPELVEED